MSELSQALPPASRPLGMIAGKALVALFTLTLIYVAYTVYMIGQPLFGLLVMIVALVFFFVFGLRRFYFARFIFPGIATMVLFVVFPILYTIYLGFTNYGSFNLLTFQRAQEVILEAKTVDKSAAFPFAVPPEGDAYRVYLGE